MRILSYVCISICILLTFACAGCGEEISNTPKQHSLETQDASPVKKPEEATKRPLDPKQACLKIQDTVVKKNWSGFYDMLSSEDHNRLEKFVSEKKAEWRKKVDSNPRAGYDNVPEFDMSALEFLEKSNREMVIDSLEISRYVNNLRVYENPKINIVSNDGKTAILEITGKIADYGTKIRSAKFVMVNENGDWKWSLFRSQKVEK